MASLWVVWLVIGWFQALELTLYLHFMKIDIKQWTETCPNFQNSDIRTNSSFFGLVFVYY